VPLEAPAAVGLEQALLIRRPLDAPNNPKKLAYYLTSALVGALMETLLAMAGRRWTFEESFAAAKCEVGLDHYEARRWDGWYRHMTLVMFVLAYLAVLRARLQAQQTQQEPVTHRHTATEVAKGGPLAAGRLERRPVTVDRARDPACALGGRSGGLSGGCNSDPGLVRPALSLPTASRSCLTYLQL
jgi:hypothetical protein